MIVTITIIIVIVFIIVVMSFIVPVDRSLKKVEQNAVGLGCSSLLGACVLLLREKTSAAGHFGVGLQY